MIAIMLIIQGLPSEVALNGCLCVFCLVGILTHKEAFGGLQSGSVISLALLLPIAAAIEETGLMDRAVSVMLGQPNNMTVALVRMMWPVAFLSAFLSNTAIVAMLLPIIVSWSRRLGCHPGKLLMPLSFAAQLGGSATLIGSSHCLVAKEAVASVYELGFFSCAPSALALMVISFVVIIFLAQTPLLRSSAAVLEVAGPALDAESANQSDLFYRTIFLVERGGALDKAEALQTLLTLERLIGVRSVSWDNKPGNDHASEEVEGRLKGDDALICMATASGIVALRQTRGLKPDAFNELRRLGASRRQRFLYECAVAQPPITMSARHLRSKYGCALVASRRPGSDVVPVIPTCCPEADVRQGDVLLLEADQRLVQEKMADWTTTFTVVNSIPKSSPPRNTNGMDMWRGILVCVGMLTLVTLVTLEYVKLSYGCGLLLLVLLSIRAISLKELYASIKVGVIFTIVGAFGLSVALEKTGVANLIADSMLSVFRPLGTVGIGAAIYLVSVFLSMWINNSATVAIVGKLIGSIVATLGSDPSYTERDLHQAAASFSFILILGAGTCFTTPLGYQTNMMVIPDGKYTFTDFMVFGGPAQLVHGICCIFIVPMITELMG